MPLFGDGACLVWHIYALESRVQTASLYLTWRHLVPGWVACAQCARGAETPSRHERLGLGDADAPHARDSRVFGSHGSRLAPSWPVQYAYAHSHGLAMRTALWARRVHTLASAPVRPFPPTDGNGPTAAMLQLVSYPRVWLGEWLSTGRGIRYLFLVPSPFVLYPWGVLPCTVRRGAGVMGGLAKGLIPGCSALQCGSTPLREGGWGGVLVMPSKKMGLNIYGYFSLSHFGRSPSQ